MVTLVGALIGNILGYTVFKDVCAGMYYGSYSLPTYVTIWNAEAFLLTTVVPVVIMFVVNYAILHHKLKLSPLKFLRRDLSARKQKRAVYLSPRTQDFSQIPSACDLPEYQQLSGAFCGNRFCKSASDVRPAASVRTGSLSDGDPEQYAGKIPVYAVSAGQCDGRQQ